MRPVISLCLPFLAALTIAIAVRFAAGGKYGQRLAGASVIASFLPIWEATQRPGWFPGDAFARIGHIALGAALVGLLLDAFVRQRIASAIAAAVVVTVCAWASVTGTLHLVAVSPARMVTIGLLGVIAWLVLARLDVLRQRGSIASLLIVMLALALAAVAGIAHDAALAICAGMLASAVLGYAVASAIFALPLGDAVVMGAGGTALAIAWALASREPTTRLALPLLALILFADGTASRIPLPTARISAILFPLALIGIAALPLLLAVLIAYVTLP